MPQIQQLALVYQSQWFWLLVTLGVIFFVVGRGIVPRIEKTIDQRDAKIKADLDAAEQARLAAAATENAWQADIARVHADAQAAAAEARSKAAAEAQERLHEADAELSARSAEAGARVAEARDAALAAIEDVAADAAREIVARISGVQVSQAEAAQAAKAAVAHG